MNLCSSLYCFRKRQIKLIFAVALLIWSVSSISYIMHINKILTTTRVYEYSLCNMDFILSFDVISILQDTNFTYMINPLFSACCLYLITINSRIVTTVRYKSKRSLWNNNFILIILLALVSSILLVFGTYFIAGIILGNFNNTWPTVSGFFYKVYGATTIWTSLSSILTTKKILFIIFISTFIYLSLFGSIINVLNIFMKPGYVFLLMISLVFIDYTNVCTFSPLKSVIITLDNIINISTLIIKDLCYSLLIYCLYVIGKFSIVDKDQFIKTNNL